MMHYLRMICLALLFSSFASAQVVVTIPQFATQFDSITIIFDATQGNQGLMGYTGVVYAHTGVITNESTSSTDWKHVIGTWGDNTTQPALTRIGTDLYELVIGFPRQFYSVTNPNEQILQLAFVFRSADSQLTGRDVGGADIFADLFEPGLTVVISEPQVSAQFGDPERSPYFAGLQDTVHIVATAAEIGTRISFFQLFLDGTLVAQAPGDTLRHDFLTAGQSSGLHHFSVVGHDTASLADTASFVVMINPPVVDSPPPAGIQPGINYVNNSTVTLALFAPFKQFVYVLGDFNDWRVSTSFYMNRHQVSADSVLWWLTVSGLNPGEEYAFQYLVDGNLRIGDPYTDKVLDPWNDGFIPPITYPNLKPYPQGLTEQPVAVLQTAQPPFTWVYSDTFQRPAQEDLVIYELLLRDFLARHDFQTLTDTLDYLHNLGVNAIEVMPFSEFEGNSSWGYNPSFYFAPDKYYGPEAALKSFIDECHHRGIAVIMDIVLNHSFGQSPLVRLYWDEQNSRPSPENPWYNVVSPNPVFSFGFDFNHESPHTKAFVDRVNRYWMSEYRVDGFRFDFTKGFTNTPGNGWARDPARIAILKRMADQIWATDSSAYVILEHFTENSEEKELAEYRRGMMLWGNMNYNYNEATMGYHSNNGSDFSWGYYGNRGWNKAGLVTYMESHDEERLMYKNLQFGNHNGNYDVRNLPTALERMKLAGAFFFTYPGPKMLWQFGELGYDVSIDDPCRVCEKPIRWNYLTQIDRQRLYKTWSALIHLRHNYRVFRDPQTQVNMWLTDGSGRKRINLQHPDMDVSIVGNFGITTLSIGGNFPHNGWWYNYFTGDSIEVTSQGQSVELGPGTFALLTDVRLPLPEPGLVTGIDPLPGMPGVPARFALHANYPNPFNPETTIAFEVGRSAAVHLVIFNALGQQVKTLVDETLQPGEYRVTWNGRDDRGIPVASGVYFISLRAENFASHRRMVLLK